jgi:hypothetical protein
VPAKELQPGDRLLSKDGQSIELREIRREFQQQPVFNLGLWGMHNYLVGQVGLLVHNEKVDETYLA